jgi:hypothetical protein
MTAQRDALHRARFRGVRTMKIDAASLFWE